MNHTRSKWIVFSLIIITILCLIPFINKAFHIDDTLFLWCAEHIQGNPADFYGFTKNWYIFDEPMFLINQNPPLVSYYISFVSYFFGWDEIVLHTAFLIPAVFLSVGIYYLARFFCPLPYFAVLISVFSPAFIVSSTTVMSDISMMALYVWAAVFWLYGLKRGKYIFFLYSVILISLSSLYKYFGITMVPLLFIYTLSVKPRPGLWILFLSVPVIILCVFQEITQNLYGSGLFLNAASYAVGRGITDKGLIFKKFITVLSFSGGCIASVIFFTHLFWSKRTLAVGGVMLLFLIIAIFFVEPLGTYLMPKVKEIKWYMAVQLAILIMAGIQILFLTIIELWECRDSKSLLLFLWIFGTLFFSGFVNWSTNARVILPIVPAVGILVARRLDKRIDLTTYSGILRYSSPLILAAVLAMSVAWADTALANCQRKAAHFFSSKFKDCSHATWFQGHWGFQYYMESFGAKPLDVYNSIIEKGDILITPSNNTNVIPLPEMPEVLKPVEKARLMPCKWLTTVSLKSGAGFYSDEKGPLPFFFGKINPEEYIISRAHRKFDFVIK